MSTQLRRPLTFGTMLALAAAGFFSCSDSGNSGGGGTGVTVTITAPGVVSPQGNLPANPPTLTVTNVTVSDGSGATYTFQIASDSAFASIVRQVGGIGQGSAQTSWAVDGALANGTYFWRARGVSGATNGPWSAVTQIVASGGGGGVGAGETQVVFDPLTNGMTLGEQHGGSFIPQGWRINTNHDFIRYEVPTVTNGYVEWQNLGLTQRGANDASHMMFGMWDPSAGAFRQNPFRVHVQKLWNNPHNPPFMRFRWISQGREHEAGHGFTGWDPSQVYTFRVDWRPSGGAANTARVFLNDAEIMTISYNRTYSPNTHFIELGIGERGESVIDAIYRNFSVVRR